LSSANKFITCGVGSDRRERDAKTALLPACNLKTIPRTLFEWKIILKCVMQKYDGRIRIGFVWLGTGVRSELS